MQLVSPRGKAHVSINDDYNFDPNSGDVCQPEGLPGRLEIDIFSLIGMELDNDHIDEDEGE